MIILAIDPGSTESGVVIFDSEKQIVIDARKCSNEEVLQLISERQHAPATLVIEMIRSYGMAVGATTFETCVWIGKFMQCWGNDGCYRIGRMDVKMHLCKSPRAKDPHIRQALIDRFGLVPTKKRPNPNYSGIKLAKDMWAALAVAVTWSDTN